MASPVCWISKKTSPFLIFHGEKDSVVPVSQSIELAKMLKDNGIPVTLVILPGLEHTGVGGSKVDVQIMAFFKKYLMAH